MPEYSMVHEIGIWPLASHINDW